MTITDRRVTDRVPTELVAPAAAGLRVSQHRVLAAEAVKFAGLRSSWWLVIAGVLSIVAAGVFPALALRFAGSDSAGGVDPTGGALSGISFTQLLIAALGVLVVTSEYSTGLIRATFTAVPKRLPVLWAKAAIAALVTFVASLVAVFIAFFAAKAALSAAGVTVSLGEPGVLRALVGSGLYMAVTAVLAVAFGALVRSAIGAMAALFGLLFVTPLLGLFLPQIDPYLPTNAGGAIMQTGSAGGGLPPWIGLGVFTLYAGAALTAAAIALTRRDT